MQFLDVKTDYAFKKVFGSEQSKEILISFLNSIIEFENNYKIKDLDIIDPYNIPVLKGMKDTFVDVKAKLENDTKVIIEMQVLNHDGFEKRILYNTAKNYSQQLEKGNQYHLLNPVIALTIVNFDMFEFDKYKSSFKLLEKENFTTYKDDIELIFIELPKFQKSLQECENIEDKWLYFIKNSEDLTIVPKDLEDEIKTAYEIANTSNYTIDELELQRKRKEFIYIQRNSIEKAKRDALKQGLKEGIEQGLEQGLEQGEKNKQIEIARNLLDILDIETIALKTGLTTFEVEHLKK
ncbi:MAG: Rpn family recombination-promoting nuclease/putative transposase [Campylobacterota bacterium]|nr:Rpn family recombination-promoting nuclease/putative transposase [Campylobacterota bacterium]